MARRGPRSHLARIISFRQLVPITIRSVRGKNGDGFKLCSYWMPKKSPREVGLNLCGTPGGI